MRIQKATARYETWLGKQIPLLRRDLDLKHRRMRQDPFSFLRAAFYRWSQTFPRVCEDLMDAPQVLGVGDLHVENFGTWRDIEGRLIWGVNDFDEACRLPCAVDLVRLTASAHLAIDGAHLAISKERASEAILEGYAAGLRAGGRTFVLAERHHALREAAVERLKQPEKFWEKLYALPPVNQEIPDGARKGLRKAMPEGSSALRVVHRIAGLGSLGRRRYVALGQWHGGNLAREAKELARSAWRWDHSSRSGPRIRYEDMLRQSVRCPDPFVRVRGRWLLRRLAPDCSRIELASLPRNHDAFRLLHAMGWETANVHLGSAAAARLLKDLSERASSWLHAAAGAMVESTLEDWSGWRRERK